MSVCIQVEEWDKGKASVNIVTSHNMFVFFSRVREILDATVNLLRAWETVIIPESDCSVFSLQKNKEKWLE